MGRKDTGKTDPKQKLLVYRGTLKKLEEQLMLVQYLVEKLEEGKDISMQERAFLIDNLLVKLHKLQSRRDFYSKSVNKLEGGAIC